MAGDVLTLCVYVWRGKTRHFSNNKTVPPLLSIFTPQRRLRKRRLKHFTANNDKLPPQLIVEEELKDSNQCLN